jgi:hypothetical protein
LFQNLGRIVCRFLKGCGDAVHQLAAGAKSFGRLTPRSSLNGTKSGNPTVDRVEAWARGFIAGHRPSPSLIGDAESVGEDWSGPASPPGSATPKAVRR